MVEDLNRVTNRIQKVLEDANIKLASVASDTVGASGRAMLDAIVAGHTEAEELAEMARGKLRRKLPELRTALHGKVTDHHPKSIRRTACVRLASRMATCLAILHHRWTREGPSFPTDRATTLLAQ